MRKLFLPLALIAITAAAQIPEDMRNQITDTDAAAFFLAMDRLETLHPDVTSLVTYDSYPDGTKVISKRIDYEPKNDDWQFINITFDSIMAIPNSNRISVHNEEGKSITRAYKLKESRYDNTIDMSDLSKSGTTAAAIVKKDKDLTIAQSWTLNSGDSLGQPDLTALMARISSLTENNNRKTSIVIPYSNKQPDNAVRIPAGRQSPNHIELDQYTLFNTSVKNWINLHHQFMAYLGADAELSLTYSRTQRMVILTDYANHKIYAAKWYASATKGSGDLVIGIATYSGQTPYLPMDWCK